MSKTATLNNRIKVFNNAIDRLIGLRKDILNTEDLTKAQSGRIVNNLESLAVYLNTQVKVTTAVLEGSSLFVEVEEDPAPTNNYMEA